MDASRQRVNPRTARHDVKSKQSRVKGGREREKPWKRRGANGFSFTKRETQGDTQAAHSPSSTHSDHLLLLPSFPSFSLSPHQLRLSLVDCSFSRSLPPLESSPSRASFRVSLESDAGREIERNAHSHSRAGMQARKQSERRRQVARSDGTAREGVASREFLSIILSTGTTDPNDCTICTS